MGGGERSHCSSRHRCCKWRWGQLSPALAERSLGWHRFARKLPAEGELIVSPFAPSLQYAASRLALACGGAVAVAPGAAHGAVDVRHGAVSPNRAYKMPLFWVL